MTEDLFFPIIYFFNWAITPIILLIFCYYLILFLFMPMIKLINGRRAKKDE